MKSAFSGWRRPRCEARWSRWLPSLETTEFRRAQPWGGRATTGDHSPHSRGRSWAMGLMLGAWSIATPIGAAPDEYAHTAQAIAVTRGRFERRPNSRSSVTRRSHGAGALLGRRPLVASEVLGVCCTARHDRPRTDRILQRAAAVLPIVGAFPGGVGARPLRTPCASPETWPSTRRPVSGFSSAPAPYPASRRAARPFAHGAVHDGGIRDVVAAGLPPGAGRCACDHPDIRVPWRSGRPSP